MDRQARIAQLVAESDRAHEALSRLHRLYGASICSHSRSTGSLHSRRFNLVLIGVFGGTALLLAIAGLYGVMAYSVARRKNEIGIRMALGASDKSILRSVLRQSLLTAVIGVTVSFLCLRT